MSTITSTLPRTGTWVIDPAHSTVGFAAKHLIVSRVRGRFTSLSGILEVRDPVETSQVEVSIAAASIDTNEDQRDGHLKSPDFLDVETYPTVTFRSTDLRPAGADRWKLAGELTIRDVTRPVELDVEYLGTVTDPWGTDKAGFAAATEIDREDFGITWNQALETGGWLVGNAVRVDLDLQVVPQA